MSKILIVDDAAIMRTLLIRAVKEAGFNLELILEAGDGAEGIQRLADHPDIRLVLCDVNMPGMDGFEFVRTVRGRRSTEDLPIVIVTTEGREDALDELMAEGASAAIHKPFCPADLREVLEPYLGHLVRGETD